MAADQQELTTLERHVGAQATSPLFARLAYLYLESGRAKDALRVCDAGLATHPFYSTAHLVKGKALLELGMNGEARREFEFVKGWLPTNPTVSNLLASVPMSDDQVLDAPAAEDAASDMAAAPAEEAVAEQLADETPVVTPTDHATEAPADDANVFGLPSDAPSGEQEATTDTGSMDAFAQFGEGGGETAPQETAEAAPSAPEDAFAASFGTAAPEPAAPVEDSFDDYAARKRSELGPTDQMNLDEYLASPPPEAPASPETPAEPAMGGEDALAAAGFGATEDTTVEPSVMEGETPTPELGGMGEAETPQPDVTESAPSEHDMSGMDAFGGATETPQEETPAEETDTSSFDLSGMEAFGGGDQTATEETPGEDDFSGAPDMTPAETAEEPSGMDAFGGADTSTAGFGEEESAQPESTESVPAVEEHSGMDAFGGSTEAPVIHEEAEETPSPEFGETETAQPEVTEEAPTTEEPSGMDAFGGAPETPVVVEQPEETPAPVVEDMPAEPTPEPATEEHVFEGFVGPGETAGEAVETAEDTSTGDEGESSFPDFSGLPGTEETEQTAEETSPEPEGELEGFSGPPMEDPQAPASEPDKIEEFAEKLQDAKKITPVIDLSTQVTSETTSSADEAAADAGFVTPTLAEIYAKQGWYDDAINAYRTLAKSRPAEKDKFEQRVKELEEEKEKAD